MLKSKLQKDRFRHQIREIRTSTPSEELQQKSNQIANFIRNSSPFHKAHKIAYYHAVNGEADPSYLSKNGKLNQNSKTFYLPILSNDNTKGLLFAPISKQSVYKNNRFAIPEPIHKENELTTGDQLDLVIVPLVGFDTAGNRIGMGGGFYDRTFEFRREEKRKPTLIGFAFDFQEAESIYKESWDVSLDFIATESRLIDARLKY